MFRCFNFRKSRSRIPVRPSETEPNSKPVAKKSVTWKSPPSSFPNTQPTANMAPSEPQDRGALTPDSPQPDPPPPRSLEPKAPNTAIPASASHTKMKKGSDNENDDASSSDDDRTRVVIAKADFEFEDVPQHPGPSPPPPTTRPSASQAPPFLSARASSELVMDSKNSPSLHTIRPSVFRQYSTMYMLLSDGKGGLVSADRLVQRLRLSPSTANAMLEQADLDGNGFLDFDEFVHFMLRKDPTASIAAAAGLTQTGKDLVLDDVSLSALRRSFSEHKDDWMPTDGEARRYRMLFELIDDDKNGVLDLDELTLSLHLDEFLKTLLHKVIREEQGGSGMEVSFEVFVEAMHQYEAKIDSEFLAPSRESSSVLGDSAAAVMAATTQPPAPTLSPTALNTLLSNLFDFLAVKEDKKDVSTQRVLRLLESAMHSGKHGLATDDYALHVALQRRLLLLGEDTINMDKFARIAQRYPRCVFLTASFQNEFTHQDRIIVTDETGRRQSLIEVEMSQLAKARRQSDTQLVDSLPKATRAMFEKVFDYIDADGSGTITKDEVSGAVNEMMDNGIGEKDLESLFALLEALDNIDDHEMKFPQFVRILHGCGDIHFFDQIIVEEPPTKD